MTRLHVVRPGEHIVQIARDAGIRDWRAVWNHPDNQALKALRETPNVLLPGDEVHLPDERGKSELGATATRHRFEVKRPEPDWLRVVLRQHTGEPIANEPVEVRVGRLVIEAASNGDGLVELELPRGVSQVVLTPIRMPWLALDLAVGHLDPAWDPDAGVAIPRGVQARLHNLGFAPGAIDGRIGETTRAAIARFQEAFLDRKPGDGEPDEATCRKLVEKHRC